MGGATLASILHVANCPSPSHCSHPIVAIQLPPSNYRRPITVLESPSPLPLLLSLPSLSELPLPLPFAIAVAVAIAIAITLAVAIANAVITIFPLVHPLHVLIVVSRGGQSHCYQQWCCCCHHDQYVDGNIVFVVMAALNDGSSPLPSTNRARHTPPLLPPTTVTAIRQWLFLPALSA
jgi:hypothetical protein